MLVLLYAEFVALAIWKISGAIQVYSNWIQSRHLITSQKTDNSNVGTLLQSCLAYLSILRYHVFDWLAFCIPRSISGLKFASCEGLKWASDVKILVSSVVSLQLACECAVSHDLKLVLDSRLSLLCREGRSPLILSESSVGQRILSAW